MSPFKRYDDAAAIELGGSAVRYGSVLEAGPVFVTFRSDGGFAATFRQEDGLIVPRQGANDDGDSKPGWRLVPRCETCEMPVTGTPVTDPDDLLRRQWCSDGCFTSAAESSYEQRYQPGVTS